MTKQAETTKISEQDQIVDEQNKTRNLMDKKINLKDNVLDILQAENLDNNEKIIQKNFKNSISFIKKETSPLSSNTSYRVDYSTTSSQVSNWIESTSRNKDTLEFFIKGNNEIDLSNYQSQTSSFQESSLLDISFTSSINSESNKSASKITPFSASVTNITDFSESAFMEPKTDQIKIRKKTYFCPSYNNKVLEDGWIMKETIVRSLKKNNLEKGNFYRQKSKSAQRQSDFNISSADFENTFKNSIYPISLRYYLHLHNEKQKKIDQNINTTLLYNKTLSNNFNSKSTSSNSFCDSENMSPKASTFDKKNSPLSTNYNFEVFNKIKASSCKENVLNTRKKFGNKISKSTEDLECELTGIIEKIISIKERSKSEYRRQTCLSKNCFNYESISKNRTSKSCDRKIPSQNTINSSENLLGDFQLIFYFLLKFLF